MCSFCYTIFFFVFLSKIVCNVLSVEVGVPWPREVYGCIIFQTRLCKHTLHVIFFAIGKKLINLVLKHSCSKNIQVFISQYASVYDSVSANSFVAGIVNYCLCQWWRMLGISCDHPVGQGHLLLSIKPQAQFDFIKYFDKFRKIEVIIQISRNFL